MRPHFLGDVHLGKVFQHGVPLHRRGDREKLQWAEFLQDLETDCDLHIQVGDLFDKMFVPYTVIYRAAMAYRQARREHPHRIYAVLRGNHDASRDADKISAFQVFAELVRPFGVVVVDEKAVEIEDYVLIPWHPFKTAVEMLPENMTGLTAVGHWDIVMGDTNQIPAAEMKARGAVAAVTGHDHNKRDLEIDGLPVHVTGSMQPYSHSEDEEGRFYVTISLDELDQDLRDKHVRVVLQGNEGLDFPVDCLQLQVVREREEAEALEVDFETFDFDQLWDIATHELDPNVRIAARGKLDEARA